MERFGTMIRSNQNKLENGGWILSERDIAKASRKAGPSTRQPKRSGGDNPLRNYLQVLVMEGMEDRRCVPPKPYIKILRWENAGIEGKPSAEKGISRGKRLPARKG